MTWIIILILGALFLGLFVGAILGARASDKYYGVILDDEIRKRQEAEQRLHSRRYNAINPDTLNHILSPKHKMN